MGMHRLSKILCDDFIWGRVITGGFCFADMLAYMAVFLLLSAWGLSVQ